MDRKILSFFFLCSADSVSSRRLITRSFVIGIYFAQRSIDHFPYIFLSFRFLFSFYSPLQPGFIAPLFYSLSLLFSYPRPSPLNSFIDQTITTSPLPLCTHATKRKSLDRDEKEE